MVDYACNGTRSGGLASDVVGEGAVLVCECLEENREGPYARSAVVWRVVLALPVSVKRVLRADES